MQRPPPGRWRYLLVCPLLAWAWSACGDDPTPPSPASSEPKKLEKIEVRGPNEVDERRNSTAAKIVVNRDELTRYGDTTLLDAMKRLPGITVETNNRGGGSIKMRGLGAGYTQILVDGERAPAGFSIETLSPDLVERIEIYRGATAEFSTQAIAGTINIVLRKTAPRRHEQLKLGGSTANGRGGANASGELSDRVGRMSYALPFSINAIKFSGTSVAEQRGTDAEGVPNLDYVTESPFRGQGKSLGFTPRINWDLGDSETLGWQSFLNVNRFLGEYDDHGTLRFGEPPAYLSSNLPFESRRTSFRNNIDWNRNVGKDGRLETKLGFDYNHRSSRAIFDGIDSEGIYVLHRVVDGHATDNTLTFKGKYLFPVVAGHSFVTGWETSHAQRTEDRLERDAAPAGPDFYELDESYDARVTQLAAFAQDDWDITERLSAYLGVRWEGIDTRSDGNTFAEVHNRSGVWSPIVQALWKLPGTEKDQVRAGLARTYKAPDTFSLMPRRYIANNNTATTPDFQGNPDLKPELAWGLDLAYEHYFVKDGLFSISAYERRIENVMLTELIEVDGTFISRPANEGRATVKGIELDTKAALASLFPSAPAVDLRGNLSHHWSRVEFLAGPDNRLARQPRWSANAGFDWHLASLPLTLGTSLQVTTGGMIRTSPSQTEYSSVTRRLDTYLLWKFAPGWGELRIYGSNLLEPDGLKIETFADESGRLELTTVTPSYRTIGINWEVKY